METGIIALEQVSLLLSTGGGIAIGTIGGKAVEAIARQPEAKSITSTMILGIALQKLRPLCANCFNTLFAY